jgi:hypothetical protein
MELTDDNHRWPTYRDWLISKAAERMRAHNKLVEMHVLRALDEMSLKDIITYYGGTV